MARVCVPQGAVAGMDHGGRRYLARGGVMTVPDHVAKDLIKDGCFPAADIPTNAPGFVCGDCGFHGFFRTCGRCGGESHRPTPNTQETTHHGQVH